MSKFTDQKASFLSTELVARAVQQMKAGGVEVTRPTKAGRPWNAKFRGGPKNINIISPPRSSKENAERSELGHCKVVWDAMIGNAEAQDEEIEKRRATAAKASFSVSVLEDTPMFRSLTTFNDEIVRCAVEMLVDTGKEPFNKDMNVDELVKRTKFLLRVRPDSKYNPNIDVVVKPGPSDKKFTAGFLTEGYDKETGGLEIDEEPSFSWDNLEHFVKKGSMVQKIKGNMEYASVSYRGGEISSINLQFQVSKVNLSLPIDAKDAYDSDEIVKPRSPKRARLAQSASRGCEEEEAASQGDDTSEH